MRRRPPRSTRTDACLPYRTLLLRLERRHLAIALARDDLHAVHEAAGAGRDKTADNDVFLQAVERVDLAIDRRVGEHASRLLEGGGGDERSEEHTSELQSLMRISYAVFCMKKKK